MDRFNFFKNVVAVPDASKTTLAWSFGAFGNPDLWVALITMLYLDFLDATGTLFSMGECHTLSACSVLSGHTQAVAACSADSAASPCSVQCSAERSFCSMQR